MDQIELFNRECIKNINEQGNDINLKLKTIDYLKELDKYKYAYNFTWLGRPIIQLPQDIYTIQELIWKIKPDLIIETGIAHGGSLIMSASILALLDYCEGYSIENSSGRQVIGIDIEIRSHNKKAIEDHVLYPLIQMIEGSSIDYNIIKQVEEIINERSYYDKEKQIRHPIIMIFLDSNHSHKHVLAELESYAPLVSIGSYCIVFDTLIDDIQNNNEHRWGINNNPKTAIHEFLLRNNNFEIDKNIENKLLLTCAPNGFLKRIK
jgi:cephalosporin hydroxylase